MVAKMSEHGFLDYIMTRNFLEVRGYTYRI